MHVFWSKRETTATEARDELARSGRDLAYTTVATQVRILLDKGFLIQVNDDRPFRYRAARTFEDVSRSLLGDLIERVFRGSREQLLVRLMEREALTREERARIEEILRESRP